MSVLIPRMQVERPVCGGNKCYLRERRYLPCDAVVSIVLWKQNVRLNSAVGKYGPSSHNGEIMNGNEINFS
jgi:hypothetical protein